MTSIMIRTREWNIEKLVELNSYRDELRCVHQNRHSEAIMYMRYNIL
jgi:hypothetical protein